MEHLDIRPMWESEKRSQVVGWDFDNSGSRRKSGRCELGSRAEGKSLGKKKLLKKTIGFGSLSGSI